PHLNPLPFVKGRGGVIRVAQWFLARCCSRAVNHAAWAQTKRHFFFAENRSGKFNSKHCRNWNRKKFLFQRALIHRGGATMSYSSQTFHRHAAHSAVSLHP